MKKYNIGDVVLATEYRYGHYNATIEGMVLGKDSSGYFLRRLFQKDNDGTYYRTELFDRYFRPWLTSKKLTPTIFKKMFNRQGPYIMYREALIKTKKNKQRAIENTNSYSIVLINKKIGERDNIKYNKILETISPT